MKTFFFSLLLILSYHFSEAQAKETLFKKIETILNKAEGKTFTRLEHGDAKNSPRYVVNKQVFRQSMVSISFADGKTGFAEAHTGIDWTGAFEYWVMRTDPYNPAIIALDFSFDNEHAAKLSQNGKAYSEGNTEALTLYFQASDRDEMKSLLNAMEKLQEAN